MDDFEVERRADPHGVGVDQLLDYEGASVTASLGDQRSLTAHIWGFGKLFGQALRLLVGKPLARALAALTSCCHVQVVQAVTACGVNRDGLRVERLGQWRAVWRRMFAVMAISCMILGITRSINLGNGEEEILKICRGRG